MTVRSQELANLPVLNMLNAAPARPGEVSLLYRFAQSQLGEVLAPFEEVQRIYDFNNSSILVLHQGGDQAEKIGFEGSDIIGFLAILYLSVAGEQAIIDGRFTPGELDLNWLVRETEEPQAVYTWAVAAITRPGKLRLAKIAQNLSFDVFDGVNQYGFAFTDAGRLFLGKLGYVDALSLYPSVRPGTFVRKGGSQPDDSDPTGSVSPIPINQRQRE